VLANSGHEPFGCVGLETMAAGGLACTGGTGEDYAVPGWNALVLQTQDPLEFLRQFRRLRANPNEERALRQRGRLTAKQYAWPEIIRRDLLPHFCEQSPAGGQWARPGLDEARRHASLRLPLRQTALRGESIEPEISYAALTS